MDCRRGDTRPLRCYALFLWLLLLCTEYGFFFFFQAEDGIRDVAVTGVQTCALPISIFGPCLSRPLDGSRDAEVHNLTTTTANVIIALAIDPRKTAREQELINRDLARRSEERRVGKECRSRGWPYHNNESQKCSMRRC